MSSGRGGESVKHTYSQISSSAGPAAKRARINCYYFDTETEDDDEDGDDGDDDDEELDDEEDVGLAGDTAEDQVNAKEDGDVESPYSNIKDLTPKKPFYTKKFQSSLNAANVLAKSSSLFLKLSAKWMNIKTNCWKKGQHLSSY
jgi:hypothetical protein